MKKTWLIKARLGRTLLKYEGTLVVGLTGVLGTDAAIGGSWSMLQMPRGKVLLIPCRTGHAGCAM